MISQGNFQQKHSAIWCPNFTSNQVALMIPGRVLEGPGGSARALRDSAPAPWRKFQRSLEIARGSSRESFEVSGSSKRGKVDREWAWRVSRTGFSSSWSVASHEVRCVFSVTGTRKEGCVTSGAKRSRSRAECPTHAVFLSLSCCWTSAPHGLPSSLPTAALTTALPCSVVALAWPAAHSSGRPDVLVAWWRRGATLWRRLHEGRRPAGVRQFV